jgi:hypothetical protein
MPVAMGSTTPSTASAAIAASIALPPMRSMFAAARAARGWPVATIWLSPTTPQGSCPDNAFMAVFLCACELIVYSIPQTHKMVTKGHFTGPGSPLQG